MEIIVAIYGVLRRVAGPLKLVCIVSCIVSLALMLMSIWITGSGGLAFRWLQAATGQDSWVLALSAAAFVLFEWTLGAALILMVLRWLLRFVLLVRTDPAVAVVVAVRQTGTMVNRRPVMQLQLQCDTARGTSTATVRKLLDLGSIPRVGDRLQVRVSRFDPTCMTF